MQVVAHPSIAHVDKWVRHNPDDRIVQPVLETLEFEKSFLIEVARTQPVNVGTTVRKSTTVAA